MERAKGGVHCKYTLIHCEYTTVIYVNGNTHSQANAKELLCNGKYDIAEAQRWISVIFFLKNMSNSPRIVTQRTTVRKQLIIGQCTVLRTVNMCLWAPKYQSIWASEHPGIWTFKHPSLKMGWIVPLYNCSTYYREAFHCSSLVFPTWSSRRRRESADFRTFFTLMTFAFNGGDDIQASLWYIT